MKASLTIFENDEAARLLDYFIFYKQIVAKNEIPTDYSSTIVSLLKAKELTIK